MNFITRHSAVLQQLRRKSHQVKQLTSSQKSTDRYSVLCTLLLDALLGLALTLCLTTIISPSSVLALIHSNSPLLHFDVVSDQMMWLHHLPAGLKLNPNVTRRLSEACSAILTITKHLTNLVWHSHAVQHVYSQHSHLIEQCFALLPASVGLSVCLSAAIDLLSLCSIHIQVLIFGLRRLYCMTQSSLSCLWKLFMGRKRNVLRNNRIDSLVLLESSPVDSSVQADRCIIGTLLFSIDFFVFPTVSLYYFFLAIIQVLVQSAQLVLWIIINCINELPLFALLRRIQAGFTSFDMKSELVSSSLYAGSYYTWQSSPSSSRVSVQRHVHLVSFGSLLVPSIRAIRNRVSQHDAGAGVSLIRGRAMRLVPPL